MAKAENGVLGPVRGKVANLIFSKNLDTYYVRSNPGTRSAPNEKEQNTRDSFGGISWAFLNPIKPFLRLSYKEVAKGNRSLQAALSYLVKNALDRDGKNLSTVDPSRMLVSRGSLGLSEDIAVSLSGGSLNFSWNPSAASAPYSNDDQLMLMAYNVAEGKVATSIGEVSRRDGSASLSVADLPTGTMHVYLPFLSFDRSKASDSIYLGELEK